MSNFWWVQRSPKFQVTTKSLTFSILVSSSISRGNLGYRSRVRVASVTSWSDKVAALARDSQCWRHNIASQSYDCYPWFNNVYHLTTSSIGHGSQIQSFTFAALYAFVVVSHTIVSLANPTSTKTFVFYMSVCSSLQITRRWRELCLYNHFRREFMTLPNRCGVDLHAVYNLMLKH